MSTRALCHFLVRLVLLDGNVSLFGMIDVHGSDLDDGHHDIDHKSFHSRRVRFSPGCGMMFRCQMNPTPNGFVANPSNYWKPQPS